MGKIFKNKANNKEETGSNMEQTTVNIGEIVNNTDKEVLFREDIIKRMYSILSKSELCSVMLVGEYGCGKRSIVEGYVNFMHEERENVNVVNIDFGSLFKLTNNRKEYEDTMKNVLSHIADELDVTNVLYIRNIGHLLNFNCYENCGYIFLNVLINEIERGFLKVVATATPKEFSELESHFPSVVDHFTVLKLQELTKEQTEDILVSNRIELESLYQIELPNGIEKTICDVADKYVKSGVFPRKAIDLLDEMCSSISQKIPVDSSMDELYTDIIEIKTQLKSYISEGDYLKSVEVEKQMEQLNDKIKEFNSNLKSYVVSENEVLETLGFIVNVPMTKLSKDKTRFLKNLPDEIKKDIIGQDDTIDKIVKNIRRNQLGLRKKAHSAGNYIFIGSTGVGKTALAKSLAKHMFGSEENILRFDMSEFQSEIDVTKLLGSAPGYVGYKESGLLVKGLAAKPECVCLFDEIEKAHPKIYDVLLQLLDEGSITGSDGKKVDGSKALIIFTSNIGVKSAKELSNPMGFSNNYSEMKLKKEEDIMRKSLNKRFSPEFLNRLDSICYFNNLSRDVLNRILDKEMREMNNGIKNIIGKEIVLSDEVNEWILNKVENEHNGARPIIRLLEQEIEEEVANLVINEDPILNMKKKKIVAKLKNEKIILK